MASEEDHTVYGEEDLDEEDDEEESEEEGQQHLHLTTLADHPPQDNDYPDEDEDVDVDVDDDSTSSSNHALAPPLPPLIPSSSEVTIAVAGVTDSLPDPMHHRIEDVAIAATPSVVEKKPMPSDESRRLFQRLWTDEDEIELLQGFLDYTTQRGTHNSSSSSNSHHDTTAFYDQIKCKLQLDFNKNQLVEKLRRLKKKYRNVLSKIGSGKEYVFKTPHDQATFEISRRIWGAAGSGVAAVEEGGLDDDDGGNPNYSNAMLLNDHNYNGGIVDVNMNMNSSEKKAPRPRKRSRVKTEEKDPMFNPIQSSQSPAVVPTAASIPNLVEDTVRSCLSPLFKELLHNAMNGNCGPRGFGVGMMALNSIPLNFGGGGGDVVDEKWRKQQILELEVYSKRLELVQDQIKSQLEELRLMGS